MRPPDPLANHMSHHHPRPVLITGCSSGIGLAAAKGLLEQGYEVIATARKTTDVEKLKAQGLQCLQLDLDNSSSIKMAVEETLNMTGGKLYALFNNGGFALPAAVEDLSRDAIRAQFETNVFGWLELTNLIIPVMRQQGYGRIIINSSILGMIPYQFRGAYVASKFALEGLFSTLRLELSDTNIKVCLIEPGPIVSRIRENSLLAMQQHIDIENSFHRSAYQRVLTRLRKSGPVMKSTQEPEEVLKRVVHSLESKRPKVRYYVTTPTYLIGILRRILPYRILDWILISSSSSGKR